jgi:hypothetical protein
MFLKILNRTNKNKSNLYQLFHFIMKLVSEYLWMPFLLSVLQPRLESVAGITGQPHIFIQQFINSSTDAI